ncbi:hypothetical protein NUSPORA_03012 [Nucleospora cyclopteri]
MPFLKTKSPNFPNKDVIMVQDMALNMGYELDEESIEIMFQLLKTSLTPEKLTKILMICKEEIEEIQKDNFYN